MRWFFGNLLMVVGGLIAVLSGLCSLGVSAAVLMQRPPGLLDVVNLIVTVGFFGGIPFALGVGLFLIGWRQSRR